jgi:hypothetical protein
VFFLYVFIVSRANRPTATPSTLGPSLGASCMRKAEKEDKRLGASNIKHEKLRRSFPFIQHFFSFLSFFIFYVMVGFGLIIYGMNNFVSAKISV